MIVFYANDPEMIAYAKENGAKGITVAEAKEKLLAAIDKYFED